MSVTIARRLDDVRYGGAVRLQQLADLLPGEPALRQEVVLVAHRAVVLVLRADPGEIDHLGRARDGHDLREGALGEFAVIVVLLLEGLGARGPGRQHERGCGDDQSVHDTSPRRKFRLTQTIARNRAARKHATGLDSDAKIADWIG